MVRLGFALLMVSCCVAQTPDTATVQGTVTDPSRAPLEKARVSIMSALTNTPRTVVTDASGHYTVTGLPVGGSVIVRAEKDGFAAAKSGVLQLTGGATVSVDLQLDLAGRSAQVSVTGVAGEVRTDTPQIGDRLTGRQLEETPVLDRRITFLPLLNSANRPAINQGDIFTNQFLFTTDGTGRRQTWFEVDGASGNDSWGRQTIHTNIPQPAVLEVNILVNSFSAEYGFSAGSAVNIITRSGGNRLRAMAVEVWRPAATSAALSGFTPGNAGSGNDYTSNSLGLSQLTLGGPLSKRTHFFAAGEFSREERASPIISPIAPGSYLGRYHGWLGFLRLDHQLNDRNTLFVRSGFDGFFDTNPNGTVGGNTLPTVARIFRRRTYSEEVGETAVLSPSLLNNVRLQFQLASPITEFDPVHYGTQFQVPVSTGGTFTTGTSQSALLTARQYEINDTLSSIRGRHSLRFGGDLIQARSGGNSKEFGGPLYLGQFVYNTCTQALAYCESQAYLGNLANVRTYTQSYGNANYTVNDTLWSAFVQDDFRVRPNLTLNLGLRYERQTFTDFKLGFAPRVGFAYNLAGDGKTVMRGGFGIFDSQIVDNSQANYALTGATGVFNYTAAPGQIGFPASIAAAPLPAFPAGAAVPLRSLYIRPQRLLNPYTEQWTFGFERRVAQGWVARADYVGSHTVRINRPLDINAPTTFTRTAPGQTRSAQAANCTRPSWILFYAQNGLACNPNAATNPQPPYSVIQSDVNNGYSHYNALQLNLTGRMGQRFSVLASYTWSHTSDNVDPDVPSQNPNDALLTGKSEYANAIFDQRHRFVLSGIYVGPLGIHAGGIATLASGLPYNIVTGTNNSGDTGATTDRPVINGAVIGRNAGTGRPIYDIATLIERPFRINEHLRIEPRVEIFNLLNHANFVGYSGTYGNGATPGPGFGQPLAGVTNQLPARSFQFAIKVTL